MEKQTAGYAAAFVAILLLGMTSAVAPVRGDEIVARGQVTNLPLPRFVSIRADTANARRGPGMDQRIDWEFVRRGLPVEVTAEYGNWRRVRDMDGKGGWVHHTLISGVRTALLQGDENIAMRAKPEEDALVVAMAEPGVIARIEKCEGDWCELEADRITGWVPRHLIWGVGPNETID